MSVFFPWNNQYCTGINMVDTQHQKLVEIINNLYAAMENNQTKEVMGGLLDELVKYTEVHFTDEEKLIRSHGYPESDAHRKEHDLFTRQIIALQNRFREGKAIMTLQMANFLKKWLADHILGTDMKYVPLLKGKGVK